MAFETLTVGFRPLAPNEPLSWAKRVQECWAGRTGGDRTCGLSGARSVRSGDCAGSRRLLPPWRRRVEWARQRSERVGKIEGDGIGDFWMQPQPCHNIRRCRLGNPGDECEKKGEKRHPDRSIFHLHILHRFSTRCIHDMRRPQIRRSSILGGSHRDEKNLSVPCYVHTLRDRCVGQTGNSRTSAALDIVGFKRP